MPNITDIGNFFTKMPSYDYIFYGIVILLTVIFYSILQSFFMHSYKKSTKGVVPAKVRLKFKRFSTLFSLAVFFLLIIGAKEPLMGLSHATDNASKNLQTQVINFFKGTDHTGNYEQTKNQGNNLNN